MGALGAESRPPLERPVLRVNIMYLMRSMVGTKIRLFGWIA
jgi:hypothetical protein